MVHELVFECVAKFTEATRKPQPTPLTCKALFLSFNNIVINKGTQMVGREG